MYIYRLYELRAESTSAKLRDVRTELKIGLLMNLKLGLHGAWLDEPINESYQVKEKKNS